MRAHANTHDASRKRRREWIGGLSGEGGGVRGGGAARATVRVQKSGVMERNFNGTQEAISHFTCAHIHTDSGGGGLFVVGGGLSFTPRANDVQTFPDI